MMMKMMKMTKKMMMIEMEKTGEIKKKTTLKMKMIEIEEEEKLSKVADGKVQKVGKLTAGKEYPVLVIGKENKIVNVNKIQIVNEHKK